jgi:putative transposase
MARLKRVIVPGAAYHITARGNYRQDVFFTDDDRRHYLATLGQHAATLGLDLLGWCLMSNHVHLLAVELCECAMADTLKRVQSEYAFYMNRRRRQACGHLWQSRFYSAPIDPAAIWNVLRYIELNPVRAGITRDPMAYGWSTAAFHCGLAVPPAMLTVEAWSEVWTTADWRAALTTGPDAGDSAAIRAATARGLPFGSAEFVHQCEEHAGRPLTQRPVGRPVKTDGA